MEARGGSELDEGLHEKNFGQYIFVPVSDSHPHVLGDAYRIDGKKNLKKKSALMPVLYYLRITKRKGKVA